MFTDSSYLETLKEFRDAINYIRSDPVSYIPTLKERLNVNSISPSDDKNSSDSKSPKITKQINDLIEFLLSAKPVAEKVKISIALCKASDQLLKDNHDLSLRSDGRYRVGSVNDTEQQQILKFVEKPTLTKVIYHYGEFTTPKDCILDVLLKSGEDQESTRSMVLSSSISALGLGLSDTKENGKSVVLTLASDLTPLNPSEGSLSFEGDEGLEVVDARAGIIHRNPDKAVGFEKANPRSKNVHRSSKNWMTNIFRCCRGTGKVRKLKTAGSGEGQVQDDVHVRKL